MSEKNLKSCSLCPRNCQVDREEGKRGVCGETNEIYVARAALHFWEEPCISGQEGSGAVFFSGCPMHCVFCQNHDIANGSVGKKISAQRLSQIFLELQEKKANNINLVTPDHYAPLIAKALTDAKNNGLKIPVVYNTSSYVNVETLKLMDGLVDIYLPDFKYMSRELSKNFSRAEDYSLVAKKAIEEMVRQTGAPKFFDKKRKPNDGIGLKEETHPQYEADPIEEGLLMRKGTIVRHLVMPGHTEDSKKVIEYLYRTYGNKIYISIMNQYTPLREFPDFPELNRKLCEEEYDEVVDFAIDLGVEQGFLQEGPTAEESFIPDFNYEGV